MPQRTSTYKRPFAQEGNYLVSLSDPRWHIAHTDLRWATTKLQHLFHLLSLHEIFNSPCKILISSQRENIPLSFLHLGFTCRTSTFFPITHKTYISRWLHDTVFLSLKTIIVSNHKAVPRNVCTSSSYVQTRISRSLYEKKKKIQLLKTNIYLGKHWTIYKEKNTSNGPVSIWLKFLLDITEI